MKNTSIKTNLIYRLPRIMGFTFAGFLSIFALDALSEGNTIWEKALSLFIHLIPSLLILLTIILSRRREWIASIVFLALSVWHIFVKLGQLHWTSYLLIDGPLLLLAVLFFISWKQRK